MFSTTFGYDCMNIGVSNEVIHHDLWDIKYRIIYYLNDVLNILYKIIPNFSISFS